ncbi:cytochrome P450 2J4-like [Lineus longissimus]|uniref:cytochrome P450 2J4-like n=1 Tax=Lineus longissimus TaxID=88925 RepID=UPI002B4C693E
MLLDGTSLTLAVGALAVILLVYLLFGQYLHRFPPGPKGLPFLGCWPWMTHDWHKDFEKLGKGYGDLFTVWLLNTPVLVFQGWRAFDEAFNKQATVWCNRPISHGFLAQEVTPKTLFKTHYTEKFKFRKKFLMANVKRFSFGNKDNTGLIQDEVEAIIMLLRGKESKPFYLQKAIRIHAANPIPILFFGKAFDNDDADFEACLNNTGIWFEKMAEACEADVLPLLRFLPRKCITDGKEAGKKVIAFFKKTIAACREQYDPNDLRCFVDQCFNAGVDEEEILIHLLSYWGDATDSVPGGFRLWVHQIAHHPDVQQKIQAELDRVLGDRVASYSDRLDLPYLEASILEVLRISSPVPISLPQETLLDTEIFGYKIPVGTKYMINFCMAQNDPNVWTKPKEFDPERFITEEGKCNYKHDGWCAYGIGRRMCLGEPLSRQLMFIFVANLAQRFTFSFPEEDVPPKDPLQIAWSGVTNMPRDFQIIATPRDN